MWVGVTSIYRRLARGPDCGGCGRRSHGATHSGVGAKQRKIITKQMQVGLDDAPGRAGIWNLPPFYVRPRSPSVPVLSSLVSGRTKVVMPPRRPFLGALCYPRPRSCHWDGSVL